MESLDTDVCVVGGGPAGMAAAVEVAKCGIHVLLIDEKQHLGGQIYRRFPDGFEVDEGQLDKEYLDKDYWEGRELIKDVELLGEKIEVLKNSLVWGMFPDKEIALVQNDKSRLVRCRKLILAEGVYERPLPFPGWTLPGVYTAGGSQSLLKTQRVLPGKKFLLAGTGPLQLVLANQLIQAGAQVEAVLDASSTMGFKLLTSLWGHLGLVKDGLKYVNNLRRADVPYLRSHTIIEAFGEDEVNGAKYAKVDNDWNPIAGTEKEVAVDTICLGYGFISSVRLSQLCGCEHTFDPILKCWVPRYNENMETTVDGIFVAGDCSGVAGHLVATEEGRIAGIRISQQLGAIDETKADRRIRPIFSKIKRLRAFESAINQMTSIQPGLYSRITDGTIICRCEDVTAGEIRDIVAAAGGIDFNSIKRVTRAGMGYCQGRMCMSTIAQVVSTEKHQPIEKLGYFTYRVPTKPVSIDAFLEPSSEQA